MNINEARRYIAEKIIDYYEKGEAMHIADLVLENISGLAITERIKNKNLSLSPDQLNKLNGIIARLKQNEPVQYILGEAWFAGMKFIVDKHVLIPRPETEELVAWVIEDTGPRGPDVKILDIGTGSGIIPIVLKKKMPNADITSVDVCGEALFVAVNNAANMEADVNFILLDFLDRESWKQLKQFDIITSNPPYISKEEAKSMHPRVKGYEPPLALFIQGEDPLVFYRAIAEFGKNHLKPGGSIFVEINEWMGKEVTACFSTRGYATELRKDMQAKDRTVKLKLK